MSSGICHFYKSQEVAFGKFPSISSESAEPRVAFSCGAGPRNRGSGCRSAMNLAVGGTNAMLSCLADRILLMIIIDFAL